MKKSLLLIFLSLGLLTTTLSGCSEANPNKNKEFYCPMKCEGEKTYLSEGSCPVCEMDLKNKK